MLREEIIENLYLGGTHNILKQPEYGDINEVRDLVSFIEEEQNLRAILQDVDPCQVTVRIGRELNSDLASKYSAVTAVYTIGGSVVGTVGLLGPMRMNYARAMTIVEHITDVISEILSKDTLY